MTRTRAACGSEGPPGDHHRKATIGRRILTVVMLALLPAFALAHRDVGEQVRAAAITVPFEYTNRLIVLHGHAAGTDRDMTCLFDTGSTITVIDASLAGSGVGTLAVNEPGGSGTLTDAAGPTITVGAGMEARPVAAADLSAVSRAAGLRIDAVIGTDFAGAYVLQIDYSHETLSFTPAARYAGADLEAAYGRASWMPADASTTAGDGARAAASVVRGAASDSAVIDTGFNGALLLPDQDEPGAAVSQVTCLTSQLTASRTGPERVCVFGASETVPVDTAPLRGPALIGNGLLERFRITVDLSRGMVWATPEHLAPATSDDASD